MTLKRSSSFNPPIAHSVSLELIPRKWMRQHSARQRVWRMLPWNWYEIINLLLSASTSPNAPYAMLSGTICQFVPSFTVHPPLLLARKLNSHNKIAIYPLELSHTPRGKALSVLLCGAPQLSWASRRETDFQMETENGRISLLAQVSFSAAFCQYRMNLSKRPTLAHSTSLYQK